MNVKVERPNWVRTLPDWTPAAFIALVVGFGVVHGAERATFAGAATVLVAARLVLLRKPSWVGALRPLVFLATAIASISIACATASTHSDVVEMTAIGATAAFAGETAPRFASDRGFVTSLLAAWVLPPAVAIAITRREEAWPLVAVLLAFGGFLAGIAATRRRIAREAAAERELIAEQNDAIELRTAGLAQARTHALAALRRADAANRAKSTLLASVSHDLRTPLTAVLGYAELLLLPEVKDEDRILHAETILRSGRHLLGLLNQILDASKIEAGAMTLHRTPVRLPDLVTQIADLMRVPARARGLELVIGLDSPVPLVISTDELRLRQILENLVGNAIKFTDRGRIELRLGLEGNKLSFRVIDTGAGMTPAQTARLFGEFVQVDESTQRRNVGSGLGLHLSKKLAELFGGTLTVTSAVGVGSTFTLAIPVSAHETTKTVALLRSRRATPLEKTTHSLAGVHVLVADDTEATRALLRAFLELSGATVDAVENGERALATLASDAPAPDVVLMDIEMPVLDGIAAIRQARSQGISVKAIALTGRAASTDRERCLAAGFDDWVSKPFTRAAIVAAIERQIGTEPIDASRTSLPMHSTLGADPIVASVLDVFYDELERTQPLLRSSDAAQVAATAHSLAGAGGSFGFDALTTAARSVEESLRAKQDLRAVTTELDALVTTCRKILAWRPTPARRPSPNAASSAP